MDRTKVMEAIVNQYRQFGPRNQEHVVRESLKYIVSDMSLICLAQELGIDTDSLVGVCQ